jgi:chromosome condensin MukBEF ATPase and DNA-binding subunit MukB
MPLDEETKQRLSNLEDLKVEVAGLKQDVKHQFNRLEKLDEEIKSLHRENSKQAEQIKDAFYIADNVSVKLEDFHERAVEQREAQLRTCSLSQKTHEKLDTSIATNYKNLDERMKAVEKDRTSLMLKVATAAAGSTAVVILAALQLGLIKI